MKKKKTNINDYQERIENLENHSNDFISGNNIKNKTEQIKNLIEENNAEKLNNIISHPDNNIVSRSIYEETTGEKLPTTIAGTKQYIKEKYNNQQTSPTPQGKAVPEKYDKVSLYQDGLGEKIKKNLVFYDKTKETDTNRMGQVSEIQYKKFKKGQSTDQDNENETKLSYNKETRKEENPDGETRPETLPNTEQGTGEEPGSLQQKDSGSSKETRDVRGYGNGVSGIRPSNNDLKPEHKNLIEKEYKNQVELNKAVEGFINNEQYLGYEVIPREIKTFLKKYTGAGGLEKQGAEGKGLLSEYYTPVKIVQKMWNIAEQYVNTQNANVLEPSVGIGRFIEHAPKSVSFDAVEMNPVSAKITELLYPNTVVSVGEFQERFIDKKNNRPVKNVNPEHDIVIGNPPYGAYSGRYKGMGEGKGIARIEEYFIKRGVDVLNENGVLVYIVPSSFLKNGASFVKDAISANAKLVDAYRLPEKMFDTTSIGTDVIVLRKETGSKVQDLLHGDNWFKNNPSKVLGQVETRKNRFGKEETFVQGEKEVIDLIDTSAKNIKKTVKPEQKTAIEPFKKVEPKNTRKEAREKRVQERKKAITIPTNYETYQSEHKVSDEELSVITSTKVDGTLPSNIVAPVDYINYEDGEWYNNYNYLEGNIYDKLSQLEKDKKFITNAQYKKQKKALLKVLPEKKILNELSFVPTSDFVANFDTGLTKTTHTWSGKIEEKLSLRSMFLKYLYELKSNEKEGVPTEELSRYTKKKYLIRDTYKDNYQKQKMKSDRKRVADKLFNKFLKTELSDDLKDKITDEYNKKVNATINPNYAKFPLLVNDLSANFKGKTLEIYNAQKEGIAFLVNKGVGLLAFEVGVGKTLTGVIATVQNMQMGRCKKPLIIVPKQTFENWASEINELFPNIVVNKVGNFSKFNGDIKEGSITLATHEALDSLWYSEEALSPLSAEVMHYSQKKEDKETKRKKETKISKAENIVGLAEGGNKKHQLVDKLGIDHILVDEAHAGKNLFAGAKSGKGDSNEYQITGSQSKTAVRLFLLSQHILRNNNNRNVFMLTATPFNNSPLEIFNMLSYIGRHRLESMGIDNIYEFMEMFADTKSQFAVGVNNELKYKQVMKGFKNNQLLQKLITEFMLYKSADEAKVSRPNKITTKLELESTPEQDEIFARNEELAAKVSKANPAAAIKALSNNIVASISPHMANQPKFNKNEDDMSDKEIKAIIDGYVNGIDYKDFVEASPKIKFTVDAVAEVLKEDSQTSQIIYMPTGVSYFKKIKEYLVKEKGLTESEIITTEEATYRDGSGKKSKITIEDMASMLNDRNHPVKILIGSTKITEGMNLNKNSSAMYVLSNGWNPTQQVQVEGRIWRQGNPYENIAIYYPLLKNSADSFILQKLEEKIARLNNIWQSDKDYISTEEVNPEEVKLDLITDPAKKARMYVQIRTAEIESEVGIIESKLESLDSYKDEIEKYTGEIEYTKKRLKEVTAELAELDKQAKNNPELKKSWSYTSKVDYIDSYKKDLLKTENRIKTINKRLKASEININDYENIKRDFNTEKDRLANELKNLKEIEKEKYQEFLKKKQNEIEISKKMPDHIKDVKEAAKTFTKRRVQLSDSYEEYEQKRKQPERSVLPTHNNQKLKERKKQLDRAVRALDDTKEFIPEIRDRIRDWHANIVKKTYDVNKNINNLVKHSNKIAEKYKKKGVTGKAIREIMPFLRERTELPAEILKEKPELKVAWDTLSRAEKVGLREYADKLAELNKKYWDDYKQNNAKEYESVGDIENYITHIWDLDSKQKPLVIRYFTTNSRYAKKRSIETFFDGINGIELDNGEVLKLKPRTLDYAELLKAHSDNLIKAVENKSFAEFILKLKKNNIPIVVAANDALSDWTRISHPALKKTIIIPSDTKQGEKISPELQNILYEMGIAIGRRINEQAWGKPVAKQGEYRKYSTGDKEVRFQRWFSNKVAAHEVGHALDDILGLGEDFFNRHIDELYALNDKRINDFMQNNPKKADYAESSSEQIAELFGFMFNDPQLTEKLAPNAMQEVLERMSRNDKVAKLLPENFDWKNAKTLVEESLNTIAHTGVAVHPDIAKSVMSVFDDPNSGTILKLYDDTQGLMKLMQLGFSGFHAFALTEAAAGNLGVRKTIKVLNPAKIIDGLKNGNYDIYKQETLAKDAITHGLQIDATSDIHRHRVEEILDTLSHEVEKTGKIPFIGKYLQPAVAVPKTLEAVIKVNNKVLWDYLHNNYKLLSYQAILENLASKGKKLTPELKQEVAQWVNDSYGGQVWAMLGVSPKNQKYAQRALLSPDWFVSTFRQFMGGISSRKLQKTLNDKSQHSEFWNRAKEFSRVIGVSSINDSEIGAEYRGQVARKFWVKAIVLSAVFANILNALMRMWDEKENPDIYKGRNPISKYTMVGNAIDHKTHLFMGRYSDGTERYLRIGKQFREVPELFTNHIKKIGGKMAPLIQFTSTAFTGDSMSDFENYDLKNKEGLERHIALTGVFAKSFVPFSIASAYNPYKEFSATDLFLPSSKGMSYGKGKKLFIDAFETRDYRKIIDISNDLLDNNINALKVAKSSIRNSTEGDSESKEKRNEMYNLAKAGKDIGTSPQAIKIWNNLAEDIEEVANQRAKREETVLRIIDMFLKKQEKEEQSFKEIK